MTSSSEFHIVQELVKVAMLGSEWVLWLLIVLSVISLAVIAERFAWFRRNTRGSEELRLRIRGLLLEGRFEESIGLLDASTGVEGRVVRRALAWREGGGEALHAAVESELAAERAAIDRGLNLLGTLGNNAPFIGLFGTCIGVIQAFQFLGAAPAGGAGGMDAVMGGIAEALVATAVGIFVAIPAVVAFNSAQKKIGEIETRTWALAKLFVAWLHTQPAQAPAAAAPRREAT